MIIVGARKATVTPWRSIARSTDSGEKTGRNMCAAPCNV